MRGPLLCALALVVGLGAGALAGALPVAAPEPEAPLRAEAHAGPAPRAEPPPPRARTVPFHIEESLSESASTCAVAGGVCVEPSGPGGRVFPIARVEQVARLSVALSWQTSSPLTQRLEMILVACGDGCATGDVAVLAEQSGQSPLKLETASFDAPEGHALLLYVRVADAMPGPGTTRANLRQDFALDGSVDVRG